MSLVDQINGLAVAVKTKFNAIAPRLIPTGGVTGQLLGKTSNSNYAVGWITATKGLSVFCSGKPGDSEDIGGGISPYATTFTQANCVFKAKTAGSGTYVITITRDGTTIGSITFSAGNTTATVVITSSAVSDGQNVLLTGQADSSTAPTTISGLLR